MKSAIMFVALAAISVQSYAAMSLSEIRREARFLTDRMGHELGLSNRQYDDVYEINFDFFYQVNEVIDDVVYGYDDAIDYYYYLLDVRNETLCMCSVTVSIADLSIVTISTVLSIW